MHLLGLVASALEDDSYIVLNMPNPASSNGLRPMAPTMAAHFALTSTLEFLAEAISKPAPAMRRAQKMLRKIHPNCLAKTWRKATYREMKVKGT